jgi:hypothetical protein
MLTPLENITTRLDANGWEYEACAEEGCVTARFHTDSAQFRLQVVVDERDGIFQVVTYFPTRVPAAHRVPVAVFCSYANFGLSLGRLEFNPDDGELRTTFETPYERGNLPGEVIVDAIDCSTTLAELFHPAIMSIVYGGRDPKAAYQAMHHGDDEAKSA